MALSRISFLFPKKLIFKLFSIFKFLNFRHTLEKEFQILSVTVKMSVNTHSSLFMVTYGSLSQHSKAICDFSGHLAKYSLYNLWGRITLEELTIFDSLHTLSIIKIKLKELLTSYFAFFSVLPYNLIPHILS